MIDLLFYILCGASINLGFTLAKTKKLDNLTITWFNYLAAAAAALVTVLRTSFDGAFRLSALRDLSARTADGSLTFAVLFGALTGAVYIAALLTVQYSILRSGPSPTTMFNRLGAVLSVLLSVAFFGEEPNVFRWIGIGLAAAALVVYNWSGGFRPDGLLALTFFLGGVSEFSNKIFAAFCLESHKPAFLFSAFGAALLLCTVLLLRRPRRTILPAELGLGIGIGAVNLCSSFFILRALAVLPYAVAYPTACVGVVLLITVLSRLLFRERLGRRSMAAILMTLVSLALLNL